MKKKKGGAKASPQLPIVVIALAVIVTASYFLITKQQLIPVAEMSNDGCPTGYAQYDMENVNFSFCYPEGYGAVTEKETEIDAAVRKGTQYNVSFAQGDVTLDVETVDFAKLGDRDTAPVLADGFVCLAAAADDIAREECFNESDEVVDLVSGRDSNNRLRVASRIKVQQREGSQQTTTFLHVPNVLRDDRYNLTITSTSGAVGQILF